MKEKALNIAGRISETFVDSKLTPLFILVCVALGLVAIAQTPKEETPQIVIPSVQVVIPAPGSGAKEIEKLIVKPVESAISSISGVKHTFAMINNNLGVVVAEFEVGFDKSSAITLTQERINSIRRNLPDTALEPVVTGIDGDDIPFFNLTLTSEVYDERQLRSLGEKISNHLRSLKKVSLVRVIGGERPQVRIFLSPDRLEAYGVSITQIEMSLKASNLSIPIGSVVKGNKLSSIHLDAHVKNIDELKRLIVSHVNGVPIYLSDVATISQNTRADRKEFTYFSYREKEKSDGEALSEFSKELPAVTIAIAKKKGTNSVEVADEIFKHIDRLEKSLIPKEVKISVTRDDGLRAGQAVNDLFINLILAIVTVVFVSILFLGVREALIIGSCIPLILAIVIGADLLYGVSINRITLFALILSMGMLVDAATVVIDNIFRNHSQSVSHRISVVLATNEVGGATNLATIAIAIVFSSLIVVTGMSGEYFFPITFNVPVTMLASLAVAYIVVPWAAFRWGKKVHEKKEGFFERYVISNYKNLLSEILASKTRRRKILKITIVLILVSSLQVVWQFVRPQGPAGEVSFGAVPVSMMPKNDTNAFFVELTMPEDAPIESTYAVVSEITREIRSVALVESYQVYLGMSGPEDFNSMVRGFAFRRGENVAEIHVNLVNKKSRDIASFELVKEMRPSINEISSRHPEVRIQLVEAPPGPPMKGTVLMELYGSDDQKLNEIVQLVETELSNTWGVIEVFTSEEKEIDEFRLVIDREKAMSSGIVVPQIAELLRTINSGKKLGIMHDPAEDNQVDIYLSITHENQFDPAMLSMITIKNAMGIPIPLSELVSIEKTKREAPLSRKNGERVVYVGSELSGSVPFYVVMDLNARLKKLFADNNFNIITRNLGVTPVVADTLDGAQLLWEGEVRLTLDMFRDLAGALFVALGAVFALLVAYYKSFTLPLLAMAAIPLAVIGVFPGHWLLGAPFSGPSLIGIIALAGIVMRNSLLIIDFTANELRKGLSVEEALVEATGIRLPAISLTATTVVIGSCFMLSDPVFGGLAISLIFGTISATLLTPFIIPILVNRHIRLNGTGIFDDIPEVA